MKNVSDTGAYNLLDFAFYKALRSMSHIVGLRKITQPFWARWLASGVREEVIFRFLDRLHDIDAWPTVSVDAVNDEIARFEADRPGLSQSDVIARLRELSYICNLGQWGCLPLTDARRMLYAKCRDYYIEAETMAYGAAYQRLAIPFEEVRIHANFHAGTDADAPLIVIVHGIDGCKEEHLATELCLLRSGFAVLGIDGPGQAETFLLDGTLWRESFPASISAAIDVIEKKRLADTSRTGALGISIGGMWALQASMKDRRIKAVYDLGCMTNTRRFSKYPFLIKTRICQISGAHDADSVMPVLKPNNLEDEAKLAMVTASVRTMHGSNDRIVLLSEKEALHKRLRAVGSCPHLSLHVIDGGDHCCTGHADLVRTDSAGFFRRMLMNEDVALTV